MNGSHVLKMPVRAQPAAVAAGGLTLLARLRAQRRRLALLNALLMLCGMFALAAAPCHVMAQAADAAHVRGHDCPDCPPAPCHEVKPAACPHATDAGPSILPELPRFDAPLGVLTAPSPPVLPVVTVAAPAVPRPGPAPGRRPHLVFARFNE